MRCHPLLYEINARLFLRRMSAKYGRPLTLATIPEEEWQSLARLGFNLVWLMGVWQRSPGSRQRALHDPALRTQYDRALPGWTDEDISGSPYAVYAYRPDPSLGEPNELATLKSKLNREGLGLILDFVPNHLAFDHLWTLAHPERFVSGKEEDVRTHPDWFFATERGIYLAHGRDPYFPLWTDTVQVNFYSPELRQALTGELQRIAEVADGVRCDMAMLGLNDVFAQVWGQVVKDYPRLQNEFWAEAIGEVKQKRPDFLFIAEVYWGREEKLQQLGFDFTYDKLLYDRLRLATPGEIQSYLTADALSQSRSVRFIENHDEERAVIAFGRERSLAAAVILATLPGLRFFHEGQLEGRRVRLPVQLIREPKEDVDTEIKQFYDRLLAAIRAPAYHDGEWRLLEVHPARERDETHQGLLAWSWRYVKQFKMVVVNYSPNSAQGWLKLPLPSGKRGKAAFHDELSGTAYPPELKEANTHGLYLSLHPYQALLLDMATG